MAQELSIKQINRLVYHGMLYFPAVVNQGNYNHVTGDSTPINRVTGKRSSVKWNAGDLTKFPLLHRKWRLEPEREE